MTRQTRSQSSLLFFEKLLALLTAIACLVITIYLWQLIAGHQSMWPLPALYLVEMPALCVAVAVATIAEIPHAAVFSWIAFGALFAFSVLASFTVGLYYYPIVLMLLLVAILCSWQIRMSALQSILWAVAAALVQVSITFVGIVLG
jgi:hypothetical protein